MAIQVRQGRWTAGPLIAFMILVSSATLEALAQGIGGYQSRGSPPIALPANSRICLMPINVRFELVLEPTDVQKYVDPTGTVANRTAAAVAEAVRRLGNVLYDLTSAQGMEGFTKRCPDLDWSNPSVAVFEKCVSSLPPEERPSHILSVNVLSKIGDPEKWISTDVSACPFMMSLPGTSRTLFTATMQATATNAEVWRREIQFRDRLDVAEKRVPKAIRELLSTINFKGGDRL